MKKALAAALALWMTVAFGSIAFANQCEDLYQAFQAALGKSTKPADVKAKAKALADAGMRDHQAGNHDDAEKKLQDALDMLR